MAGVKIFEDIEGEEEWPNEDLVPMLQYCHYLIKGLVLDEPFNVCGTQNKSRIQILIDFDDKSNIGILIGPKFRVVNALLTMLRFQQYHKHNRYLEIALLKEDGEIQVVSDKKVFYSNSKNQE